MLAKLDFCQLLLMDNAAVPWFILVPETTHTELFELAPRQQALLRKEVNALSEYIKQEFSAVTKLNIAAIGNIVTQMHIHVVGRHPGDYCWPNVVWGQTIAQRYAPEQVQQIKTSLIRRLGL